MPAWSKYIKIPYGGSRVPFEKRHQNNPLSGGCKHIIIIVIQLLERPIPPPLWHKKSGWQFLGNEKSYRRTAGVKTTEFSRAFQVFKNKWNFWISVFLFFLVWPYLGNEKSYQRSADGYTTWFSVLFKIFKEKIGKTPTTKKSKKQNSCFYLLAIFRKRKELKTTEFSRTNWMSEGRNGRSQAGPMGPKPALRAAN